MTEIVKKKQIFQIAKELNISHDDIISFLEGKNVKVTSRMMKIDPEIYEIILNEFSRERQQIDRFRKDQARMVVVDTRRDDKIQTDDSQIPFIESKPKIPNSSNQSLTTTSRGPTCSFSEPSIFL